MTASLDVTDFGVIQLTTNELLTLSVDERDFLLASSFIMNDIRFYWQLMIRSPIDEPDKYVRAMQLLRWLWCSRKLAAVIFEADEALSRFVSRLPVIKTVSESTPRISKENNKSQFKDLARTIRNKAAYHYDTEVLGVGLSDFLSDANHRIYAHKQSGNSISELGEQIYTLPLMTGAGHTHENGDFDRWLRECSSSLMTFCEVMTAKILVQAFPEKTYRYQQLSMKDEAKPISHRWPLFTVLEGASIDQ